MDKFIGIVFSTLLFQKLIEHVERKISKNIEDLKSTINQLNLTFINHTIQLQQNTNYFQVHVVHSLSYTIFWTIQQSLNKFKNIEIMQRKVLLPLIIKPEINGQKKY